MRTVEREKPRAMNKISTPVVCFLIFVFCLLSVSMAHPFFVEIHTLKHSTIKTIIIDPGHGGEDYGAMGPSGIKEKDINLNIAKALEKLIAQRMGARVILTRRDDKFVPLDERTAIANENNGDMFISIHANASYRKGADGVETYFLSINASDDDAKRVAAFENTISSVGRETTNADSDDLKMILMDMVQTEFLNESSHLAEAIQENLCNILKVGNRGIKQAPFIVLAGTAMPAVLVEVGFISNANEEKRLAQKETQEVIAEAIFKGIAGFEDVLKIKMGYAYDREER